MFPSDVDECSVPGVCAVEAHCVNKEGSFDCLCPSGFTGNGFFCTYIVDREDNVTLPRGSKHSFSLFVNDFTS